MAEDFKLGPLNHIGVAVPSLPDAIETYKTLYGATDITEPFDMPAQGVKVCFVNLPNSQIELIEPLNEESPIHNFIQKNPKGGQHHVCFEVADIHQAVEVMKTRAHEAQEEHASPAKEVYKKTLASNLLCGVPSKSRVRLPP